MLQANQSDILDLYLTFWQIDKKNGLCSVFNGISLSECGQYMSPTVAKISFTSSNRKATIMSMTRAASNVRVMHVS